MTVADQLEARLFTLADANTRWVPHIPGPGQCCLIVDHDGRRPTRVICDIALAWLDRFVADYSCEPVGRFAAGWWNDRPGRTRDEIVWMLEEAVDQARWEGV